MKINIITSPRMGSTYFYNMLRNLYSPYQHFLRWNEVFNFNERKPVHDVQQIIHDAKTQTDVVAKNHITYFRELDPTQLNDFLFNIDWYNIVLLRRNFFETSLSLARSKFTDEWTTYSNNKVTIPINIFQFSMDSIYHNIKNIVHNQYKIPYHDIIYYEDLMFNPREDFPKLKLEKSYDYDQYKKWYPEIRPFKHNRNIKPAPSKKDTIENYEELQQYAQSKYRTYKNKRFIIRDGYIRRINWDKQYLDIDDFNMYNDN